MSCIPTIRTARDEDTPLIRQLLRSRGCEHDDASLRQVPGRRHILVLDDPTGGIAAVAILVLDHERAHLTQLAVARAHEGHELEARLINVADAIAHAFGATTLEIPGHRAA